MNHSLNTDTSLSEETPSEQYLVANKLRLCYDEFGKKSDPAIVLIMGLGTQMISWPDVFCQSLADKGHRVVRFDNRDIGLSEKIKLDRPLSVPNIMLRSRLGLKFWVPYTLHDMAKDTVGVLDALEIDNAHIVGASMGGMIAQLVAATYPERVRSLTSVMSTTGNPRLPSPSWRVSKQLLSRPTSGSEQELVAHALKTWAIIGSPDFPPNQDDLRERILRGIRRSFYPAGYRNQMAAIAENGDRRRTLANITAPTLVIHGKADVLVPVEGGLDTARHIKGAELKLIEGMGHDLPKELIPRLSRMITRHTLAAEEARS
ncbi:MAG: alpha/beta hydrolase [Pseudomonadota bacterium]